MKNTFVIALYHDLAVVVQLAETPKKNSKSLLPSIVASQFDRLKRATAF